MNPEIATTYSRSFPIAIDRFTSNRLKQGGLESSEGVGIGKLKGHHSGGRFSSNRLKQGATEWQRQYLKQRCVMGWCIPAQPNWDTSTTCKAAKSVASKKLKVTAQFFLHHTSSENELETKPPGYMYSEDNHPDSAQTKPKTRNIFTSPKPLEDSHLDHVGVPEDLEDDEITEDECVFGVPPGPPGSRSLPLVPGCVTTSAPNTWASRTTGFTTYARLKHSAGFSAGQKYNLGDEPMDQWLKLQHSNGELFGAEDGEFYCHTALSEGVVMDIVILHLMQLDLVSS
ncbi:hypothetical protein C8J57DRAFT_1249693 [Mycena rebaudengoi]|nr:hypothetical protein C8J57DRAFT_1249693 [Mycena rebaudengoi]